MLSVLNASAIDRDVFRMTEAFKKWEGDKYSLFIHFGLYSQLDGMWRGVPATGSGSEMIQSAAGIHYDVYEEIADKLSIETGTVKSRLFRAREQLRKILLKENYF